MSYMKQYGTAAKGNDRLLKQYGGNAGSSPMARQRYAKGGAVKAGNPSLDEGLSTAAEGAPAKPSLARPGRKMPGKGKDKKGGKTNVNVIIAQAPPKGDGMPMPPPGAGPSGPPPPMPMPPPGPGGPPMPMRKHGGAVGRFAKGGRVKRDDGGPVPGEISDAAQRKYLRKKAGDERSSAILPGALAALTGAASLMPGSGKLLRAFNIGNTAVNAASAAGHIKNARTADDEAEKFEDRKSGGRVNKMTTKGDEASKIAKKETHGEEEYAKGGKVMSRDEDEAEDRKTAAAAMHKHERVMHHAKKLTKFREGGPVMGLHNSQGGAGGAKGRLAKIKMYGK